MWQLAKIKHTIERRLIAPMRRRHKDPKFVARAVMVGLVGAFWPIPGQMPFVFAIWFVARKLKWRFSLIISLAWTWVSNTATNAPIFYAFYKVGELLRGETEALTYEQIKAMGILKSVSDLSFSVCLGSIPFMIVFGVLGYWLGYYFAKRHAKKHEQKQ